MHTELLLWLQYKEMKTYKHTKGKEGEEEEAMRGARSGERREGWGGREMSNEGIPFPRVIKLKYLVVNLTGMCSSCV